MHPRVLWICSASIFIYRIIIPIFQETMEDKHDFKGLYLVETSLWFIEGYHTSSISHVGILFSLDCVCCSNYMCCGTEKSIYRNISYNEPFHDSGWCKLKCLEIADKQSKRKCWEPHSIISNINTQELCNLFNVCAGILKKW